ncbi:hypothetical protein BGZ97_007219 [Linnemannia gamsii]|uniref:CCHC-type domain-containing protein n=1 Tax=Linnemannia gamsii TaxID=64522 RepID=A0A9P6RDF4_9FUNG|nr:hypothetical protein BGZ97_007219 [Linnemannia gamsii]
MSWDSPAGNQPSNQQWDANPPWANTQQDTAPGGAGGGGGWDSTPANASNQVSNNWSASTGKNNNSANAAPKSSSGAAPASNGRGVGGGCGGWDSPAAASGHGGWGADTGSSQADNWPAMDKQMESTSFHDNQAVPEPTMTVEEAWPAFAEADESRDLDDIKAALAQLCGAYQGKTWQELEKKLRQEKCNTYLVAVDDQVSFGYTLVNLRAEPNQRYRVISSLIKPGTAKKGRMALGVASNYDENFERLENAGVVRPSGVPRCFNCRQEGHVSSACPEEKREVERSENFGKCYNCGAEEHRSRDCPEPRKAMICRNCGNEGHQARASRDCSQPRTDVTCNRCNQVGHMIRNCPEPRTDITCNRCNEVGHFSRDCPAPKTCHRCGSEDHESRNCGQPRTDIQCNRCGEMGHIARDCPEPRTDMTPRRNRFGFDQGF